jgi:acetylornithine deacetylase/succinyl-diaminopimelate desuccinylase-like protein
MPAPTFDQDEAFGLLRRLVAIRSYPGEERRAQEAVAHWLAANGLAPQMQPTPNDQPNVLAAIENGPGPTVLLNGHIDTVLAVEGWACDPWEGRLEGDRFSGLGACDMKAGVAVNMLVARELLRRRDSWQGTLLFSCVTDEEAYSLGARAHIAAGLKADACIVTEPSYDHAIVGAAGKVLVRVTAVGKAAHAFYPDQGVNAAIELARFVAGVGEAVPSGSHPRIPTTQSILSFHSGNAQYVITVPERAEALLTRQIVPGETAESVVAELRAFADSLRSPARFEFSVEPPYYPPFELGVDTPLARALTAASAEVLGAPVPLAYTAGVADANLYMGEAGIPAFWFGPRGGDFHQNTEWVDITTLAPAAEVVLGTALRLLHSK